MVRVGLETCLNAALNIASQKYSLWLWVRRSKIGLWQIYMVTMHDCLSKWNCGNTTWKDDAKRPEIMCINCLFQPCNFLKRDREETQSVCHSSLQLFQIAFTLGAAPISYSSSIGRCHQPVQPYSTVKCFLTLFTFHFTSRLTFFFFVFYWTRNMCWLNGSRCSVHSLQHCNIIIMMPGGVKITSVVFTNKGFFRWIISASAPTKKWLKSGLRSSDQTSSHTRWWGSTIYVADGTLIYFFIPLHFFFLPLPLPHIYFTHIWCEHKITQLNFSLRWGFWFHSGLYSSVVAPSSVALYV